MKKIYSNIHPDLLLHIVFRFQDFNQPRTEIIEADNFLQSAAIRANQGQVFRAHQHIDSEVTYKTKKAQESWVVLRGCIRVTFYDVDDSILSVVHLMEHDACFTLHGGHSFMVLEDNSCILEFKSGPYEGQSKDKIWINEQD